MSRSSYDSVCLYMHLLLKHSNCFVLMHSLFYPHSLPLWTLSECVCIFTREMVRCCSVFVSSIVIQLIHCAVRTLVN